MLDERDLQAIARMMDKTLDAKLEPITARLDKLESKVDKLQEDVEVIKESQEEVRESVNRLIGWADEVRDALPFPVPKL